MKGATMNLIQRIEKLEAVRNEFKARLANMDNDELCRLIMEGERA